VNGKKSAEVALSLSSIEEPRSLVAHGGHLDLKSTEARILEESAAGERVGEVWVVCELARLTVAVERSAKAGPERM